MNFIKKLLFLATIVFSFNLQAFTIPADKLPKGELSDFINQLATKIDDANTRKLVFTIKNVDESVILEKSAAVASNPNLSNFEVKVVDSSVTIYRNEYNPTIAYAVVPSSGISEGHPLFVEFKVKSNKAKLVIFAGLEQVLEQIK